MLTYAFDLLYLIYEEEGYAPSQIATLILENNLIGFEIDPRAAALASFALAMKAREKQRRYFTKKTKDGLPTQPDIQVIEPISFKPEELDWLRDPKIAPAKQEKFWTAFEHADVLGSLIQPDADLIEPLTARVDTLEEELKFQQAALDGVDHRETLQRAKRVLEQSEMLSAKYHVVVANPPYLNRKHMNVGTRSRLAKQYPQARADTFAAFVARAIQATPRGGRMGFMSPYVWMFLSSYEEFRNLLLRHANVSSLIQLEYSGFAEATVPICAFTVVNSSFEKPASFIRLTDFVGPQIQGPTTNSILRAWAGRSGGHHDKDFELLQHIYWLRPQVFARVPGDILAYWLSPKILLALASDNRLNERASPRKGLDTANNNRFLRLWWETSASARAAGCPSTQAAVLSNKTWFPYNKGGAYRKWWGNHEYVINWRNDGFEVRRFGTENGGRPRSNIRNASTYFQPSISWSSVSSGHPSFRAYPQGFLYDSAGASIFAPTKRVSDDLLAITNSSVTLALLEALAPTLNFVIGATAALPLPSSFKGLDPTPMVDNARDDWNAFETSWDFETPPVTKKGSLRDAYQVHYERSLAKAAEQQRLEEENNQKVAELYGLEGEVPIGVPLDRVSLTLNPEFRYGADKTPEEYEELFMRDAAMDLMSYAVGVIFGRFSPDKPGFILMDQGSTVEDFYEQVPDPSFAPTETGIAPMVAGDWFEDDLSNQVKTFIRTAFGDEHYEENIAWIEDALGVKSLEDYFPKKFWADHLQRYKKRPIYWLFSSGWGKDSFYALIYLHRYTPDTVGQVLNRYVRELIDKQRVALESAERRAADDGLPGPERTKARRAVRDLRSSLEDLEKYDKEVLHPLSGERVELDLDDGVKVNYPKLYPALRKVPGL